MYQKGLAASIKTSPKSFWSHVKEGKKSKSTFSDLRDKDGDLKTKDQEKANVLNEFFSSVFTVEGNSELPYFEQKVKDENCINQIEIKAVKVLKQLKSLNVSKSCGPDNCHPFILKECAEEIYLLLTDIFINHYQAVSFQMLGKRQMSHVYLKKEIKRILKTIGQCN